MQSARLRVLLPLLGCLLSAASSTRPECSIMLEIEEERSQCLAEITEDNQTSGCRRQWDNITCWPEAQVGAVVVKPCPKYFRFLTTFLGNVSRNCTSQGWTDVYPAPYAVACGYDSNSTPGEEQTAFYGTVKTGYTIGHTLSLIALTAAMIILCLFRKLHCTRNYIHMHLFMSFIMRAIAVFIKDVILFESGEPEHCFVSSISLLVGFISVNNSQWTDYSAYSYFQIVTMCDFVMILFFYIIHILRIYRTLTCVSWPLAEFLHYLIGTILLLIASIVAASKSYNFSGLVAGANVGRME